MVCPHVMTGAVLQDVLGNGIPFGRGCGWGGGSIGTVTGERGCGRGGKGPSGDTGPHDIVTWLTMARPRYPDTTVGWGTPRDTKDIVLSWGHSAVFVSSLWASQCREAHTFDSWVPAQLGARMLLVQVIPSAWHTPVPPSFCRQLVPQTHPMPEV